MAGRQGVSDAVCGGARKPAAFSPTVGMRAVYDLYRLPALSSVPFLLRVLLARCHSGCHSAVAFRESPQARSAADKFRGNPTGDSAEPSHRTPRVNAAAFSGIYPYSERCADSRDSRRYNCRSLAWLFHDTRCPPIPMALPGPLPSSQSRASATYAPSALRNHLTMRR